MGKKMRTAITPTREENYPKWYIKNNKCLPTIKEVCEKSTKIFLNTDEVKEIAGKYYQYLMV